MHPTDDEIPLLSPGVPLHRHLGLRPVPVERGRGRIDMTVEPHHLRTLGVLHGGIFAILLDASMGGAAASVAREGFDVVTVQLNVNYLRTVPRGERLSAHAEVLHAGRRTAVARGEILTSDGQLVATGSATLMYLPHQPADSEPGVSG